jgi:hypothetical protein
MDVSVVFRNIMDEWHNSLKIVSIKDKNTNAFIVTINDACILNEIYEMRIFFRNLSEELCIQNNFEYVKDIDSWLVNSMDTSSLFGQEDIQKIRQKTIDPKITFNLNASANILSTFDKLATNDKLHKELEKIMMCTKYKHDPNVKCKAFFCAIHIRRLSYYWYKNFAKCEEDINGLIQYLTSAQIGGMIFSSYKGDHKNNIKNNNFCLGLMKGDKRKCEYIIKFIKDYYNKHPGLEAEIDCLYKTDNFKTEIGKHINFNNDPTQDQIVTIKDNKGDLEKNINKDRIRQLIWKTYTSNINSPKCTVCNNNFLSKKTFCYGFIGLNEPTEINVNNVRPICPECHKIVESTNMTDYMNKNGILIKLH